MTKEEYDSPFGEEWEKNHFALYMERGRKELDMLVHEIAELPFPLRQIRLFRMRLHREIQSRRFRHRLAVDPEFRRRVWNGLKMYEEIQREKAGYEQPDQAAIKQNTTSFQK